MKLSRLLTLSTAALAVLVCGMLGHITRNAWLRYDAAGNGVQALRLTRAAMLAAEKLSFERGPVNAVLGDRVPADPARRERLRRGRAGTDLALMQLERALQSDDGQGPGRHATLAPLRSALAAARRSVDQLAALPPPQRAPQQLKYSTEQLFALVPLALDAVGSYTQASELASPGITRALIKARYAVELREYAGRLGSVLTVPLATRQPLTPAEHTRLENLRGRIDQLRQQVQAGDSGGLAVVLQRVDDIYFGEGLQLVAGIEQASRAGRAYALDTEQLAQRYVPTMAPILALRDELLEDARRQAEHHQRQARGELWIAILSGIAILLALALLLLIVRRRVIMPLLRVTRAVIRLGDDDYSRDPAGLQRADEIGDMARALATLRSNSIERQQLELERQSLIEELRQRANTDYLTGILNRRAFAAAGKQRLQRACQHQETLAVLLFDIDHFKSVNDTHGHEVGDQVLIRVAALVRDALREGEIVARHGGEEFVVMPAHCSLEQACALAERLRQAIERTALTLAGGQVLRVTASFGVACATGPAAALDDLLHAADVALYHAKRQGRNRVEAAG